MAKLIGIACIYLGGITLSGLLAVGLLLTLFYIIKKVSNMTEDTWGEYFNKLSNNRMLVYGFIIYLISLCLIGVLSFILFELLRYEYSILLSNCFVWIGICYIVFEFYRNKDMLLNKLNRLRN